MSDNKQKVAVSFPLLGVLGLIFITLKLTGHISWSWWWVLAPFWGGLALVLAVFALGLLFVLGAAGIAYLLDRSGPGSRRRGF